MARVDDAAMMRLALREAARGRGRTSPNPMVGCVIARGGQVLASGYHRRCGEAHAEVAALRKLGMRAPGATMYVTLEPCNHQGRTGPCAPRVAESGVRRVVVGMGDPFELVDGRGVAHLRAAGLEVAVGLLEAECRRLNRAWLHFVAAGRPFVTLKLAATLDGRLATAGGDSRWITGEAARAEAHRMRDRTDAILVGAGTVLADDPALTTRLAGRRRGRDPLRVILDGALRVAPDARCLAGGALVATTRGADARRAAALEGAGAELLRLPARRGARGRVDLAALLAELARRRVVTLLVEGGGETAWGFLEAGLVDELCAIYAPIVVGGRDAAPMVGGAGVRALADAWRLEEVSLRRLGQDIMIRGVPCSPASSRTPGASRGSSARATRSR